MDRLTKYATESNPYDESFIHIVTAIREIPTSIVKTIQLPSNQAQIDSLTKEAISGYISTYYYCAVANVFAGLHLPPAEQFDVAGPSAEYHKLLKETVDSSAADFRTMEGILRSVAPGQIQGNPLNHMYKRANDFWRPLVRDTAEVFVNRSKPHQET